MLKKIFWMDNFIFRVQAQTKKALPNNEQSLYFVNVFDNLVTN